MTCGERRCIIVAVRTSEQFLLQRLSKLEQRRHRRRQTVPDLRGSDEEGPITDCFVIRPWNVKERRQCKTLPTARVNVGNSSARYCGTVPLRQRCRRIRRYGTQSAEGPEASWLHGGAESRARFSGPCKQVERQHCAPTGVYSTALQVDQPSSNSRIVKTWQC